MRSTLRAVPATVPDPFLNRVRYRGHLDNSRLQFEREKKGHVAFIGGSTAFFAATIAVVQTDIKRVIAYSTCSQLGYMFAACGVSAYSAGIFHLEPGFAQIGFDNLFQLKCGMIASNDDGRIIHSFTPFGYAPSSHVLRNAFISYLYQRSTARKKAWGPIVQKPIQKKAIGKLVANGFPKVQ